LPLLLWLRRSERLSTGALEAAQDRRLAALIAHAYANVPLYRRRFDAAGIVPSRFRGLEDLARLPILTRKDVSSSRADLVAGNARRFRPVARSTSGTTGSRLEFLTDAASTAIADAALWRFRAWHGAWPGHRLANIQITNAYRTSAGDIDPSRLRRYVPWARTLYLNPIPTDADRLRFIAGELARFRPVALLSGPPSRAVLLGRYLLQHPACRVRPRVVFTGGERVYDDQRALLAEAFATRVVEVYGNEERAVFAGECREGRLHIASEMGIVEIVRDGVRCPPGEVGEIVITNLWNRAFPFIRYAIGDVGYVEPEGCPCGRGLPTCRVIGGREKDLLATRRGPYWLPNSIAATPRWRGKIDGVRFYQEVPDAVAVQVVKGPEFTGEDAEALRAHLHRLLDGLLDFTIEYHDSLDQTPGGKFRYVLSRVPTRP